MLDHQKTLEPLLPWRTGGLAGASQPGGVGVVGPDPHKSGVVI